MNVSDRASESLVEYLQSQQHLHPHRPLMATLHVIQEATGLCPAASEQAVSALALDPDFKIGRLRRCQILQLARTLHRLWRQNRAAPSHPFQPA